MPQKKQPPYQELNPEESFDVDHRPTGLGRRTFLDFLAAGGVASAFPHLAGCSKDEAKSEKPATAPEGVSAAAAKAEKAAPEADAELPEVKIGYLPITDSTPLLVAHAMGYFEEEGLKAVKPTLVRGWSPLIEAFTSGKVNLVHFLKPIPVWMRYNNDMKVKIMSWAHTNGSAIVVGKDTGITDFRGFGGKQIAVPFWYSMHNIVLQHGLRSAGIKAVIKNAGEPIASDEVNLQVMPPPEMPAALAAKKIDAFTVAEPFNALGELKAGGKVLRFTGDIWKNHPCCVICMRETEIEQQPAWAQKAMNALVRAGIYASKNKEEVAKMLSRDGKGYLPMPAKVVVKAMTDYRPEHYGLKHPEWQNGRVDFQPWPYPSATRMITSSMNETVVGGDKTFLSKLDPEFVAKDLVNYEFVKNACEKYPAWKEDPSVNASDPYSRTETLSI